MMMMIKIKGWLIWQLMKKFFFFQFKKLECIYFWMPWMMMMMIMKAHRHINRLVVVVVNGGGWENWKEKKNVWILKFFNQKKKDTRHWTEMKQKFWPNFFFCLPEDIFRTGNVIVNICVCVMFTWENMDKKSRPDWEIMFGNKQKISQKKIMNKNTKEINEEKNVWWF